VRRAAIAGKAALGAAAAFAATLPLLLHGASCGQDFDFHLQSWLAVREAWHESLFIPHWVPAANYGAGEPRFVFYPPLSWLLGALLSLLLPWTSVPAAFTAVCVAGAATAMYTAAARFCSRPSAALAAILYALSPYLLFTGLERTAFGELLAAVWMPLLLDALLRERLPVARTALLVAAIWYTNAPAGVMACYMVLFATVWVAAGGHDRRATLLRGGAALTLGCALAADTLLPSWYEQHWVSIARAVGPGMRVEDSFLFAHTGESYHDQVLFTASCIAIVTLGAGLLSWAVLQLARGSLGGKQTRTSHLLGALLLGILLLQFRASDPLWNLLPELHFLQFPWRLLLPASAATALLLTLALTRTCTRIFSQIFTRVRAAPPQSVLLPMLALVYATGMVAWAAHTRYQPCDEEDNVTAQFALLQSGAGFEGTDEYTALGSDNGEIQRGLPLVRLLHQPDGDEGDNIAAVNPAWKPAPAASATREITGEVTGKVDGQVDIEQWQPESLLVRVRPVVQAYAVLRLERFPAWRILLNGHPCRNACVAREDGLLTVQVPGGQLSTIEGRYAVTGDVWLGRGFSIFALVTLVIGGRLSKKLGRRQARPRL